MQPIIMQDWITIRGTSSTTPVAMSQSDWLMTAPFQDISFYLDVREVAGPVAVKFETAPSRDDAQGSSLFVAMASLSVSTVGQTVTNVYAANANFPVSHWTRWSLTGPGSAWDITFRVMAAGNSIC